MSGTREAPRRVVLLTFDGVQSLDVTGPLEVLAGAAGAAALAGRPDRGYDVSTVAPSHGPITTSSGLRMLPHAAIDEIRGRPDTLIVAGGPGARADVAAETVAWIARTARVARRVASVCTGAFLLARAGILDGRRATTHWYVADALQREHPQIDVDPEPIFVRDGKVWTSAGVTAGMDLALALVEEDLGREVALTIARHLVLFLRRPGSQAQFSAALASPQPERATLREVQRRVVEEPAGHHTVEAMAERANMSPRHFARAFLAETGLTPARYVERVRIEAARRALEDTGASVSTVADACGFGTPETMRRAFLRTLGVGPAEYRRRFQPAGIGAVA